MLNTIQLEDKAQEFLIQAKGEKKSAIKNHLIDFAKALRHFKGMINNGETEMYFQKALIKAEGNLDTFLQGYYERKERSISDAKEYANLHNLHDLELSCKYLRFLLGIKHVSVL